MKKITLITAFLTVLPLASFSQRLNLNAGTSFSKLDFNYEFSENLNGYNHFTVGSHISINYDYVEKSSFLLSSGIHYVQKGGQDEIPLVDMNGNYLGDITVYRHFNYVGANTFINYKLEKLFLEKLHPYVFAGPRVDILLSEKSNDQLKLDGVNDIMIGFNGGIGLRYDWNRINLGFRAQYFQNFHPMYRRKEGEFSFVDAINDYTFSTQLSVGYNF
ncbi:hypothetical protein SAMN05216474_1114 [Lishizhenia tianjinensis]|uniref:Outer membrane protein beta-barrel domain-containing protein n=1 Tax=Lishizhenia tianjinensis TaxID=477690 RepID=A0A1I6YRG3_9FLAO|nr:hypothetical protein [Lishizhenia tianjinensis]SFT53046.1 hypothetical protein SAMN05216474_1114 [Lishizhenia tianjinensis]